MEQLVQFQVSPEQAKNKTYLRQRIAEKLQLSENAFQFQWHRRSIDARQKRIKINVSFRVYSKDKAEEKEPYFQPKNVAGKQKVHIIGAGPAGLFAALRALELGLKPILFERGKDVRSRRRDIAELNKEGIVDEDSNYCFGEGGAGTYSDGKLYTRSKKRGDILKALEWFVHFGAEEDILIDAHPHIGTNKLPKIITKMREIIEEYGGEVHFGHKLTDISLKNGKVTALTVNDFQQVSTENVILATGHSARDIYEILNKQGVKLEAKPFAMGVRIEHTQELIDKMQYHGKVHDDFLPPASYSLVTQVNGRGVYSFCMCPGGIIAPCATKDGEVVTNGWSPSKRNNPYSNSGVVVTVEPSDCSEDSSNPFACLDFQKAIEQKCWEAAGKQQKVPAQRMVDFVENKKSIDFPRSSYQPGIVSVNLNKVLPTFIVESLRAAFLAFDKKMNGYLTNDAVLHAPESRTSSPIKIPRNKETLEHEEIAGLYPCAEGAGYAGGIISAAMDGMRCMEKIAEKIK